METVVAVFGRFLRTSPGAERLKKGLCGKKPFNQAGKNDAQCRSTGKGLSPYAVLHRKGHFAGWPFLIEKNRVSSKKDMLMPKQSPSSAIPACHGIIPSRYASIRFPGKPLADIAGKPMFWHVYTGAASCPELASLHLATDDERIAGAAEALGVPCIMTSSDHVSGTNRVYEAAQKLGLSDNAVIFNIQGDEAGLAPHVLSDLAAAFADPAVRVATPATDMEPDDLANPNRVKVVLAQNGNALYFSRSPIPYARAGTPAYLLHIGLYGFTMKTLAEFTGFAPGVLEQHEQLEQLRFLENSVPIRVVKTSYRGIGIDTPEDLEILKKMRRKSAKRG